MTPRRQTAQEILAAEVTEREFQAQVIELATMLGWRVYHTHDSRRSHKGYPDLTLVRPSDHRQGRIVFAELKSERGKVRPEQREWLADLASIGPPVESFLWRPSDLEAIGQVLAR